MAMFLAKNLCTDHKDLIHDIAFDFYGRRIATSSSDQNVKIWDQNVSGEWICSYTIKMHYASVWKIDWAHPEFGQIIATCSFDRNAVIFEESIGESSDQGIQSPWFKRASLVDSKSSVTGVKFAPKCHGLQLATCSADGVVRIYEATDVMNLCHWPLMHEIQTKLPSCSCISWSPSPSSLDPPLIAVGSDDQNSSNIGKVVLFEFSDSLRKWIKVESIISVNDPVHDVAFAPNPGRSYHLFAVATKDLQILAIKPIGRSERNKNVFSSFEVRQAARFEDHGSSVWRVSWNITGTLLTSSGDDGCVRLWKANYMDVWKCISTLKGSEIHVDVKTTGTIPQEDDVNDQAVHKSFVNLSSSKKTANFYQLSATTHPNQHPWH